MNVAGPFPHPRPCRSQSSHRASRIDAPIIIDPAREPTTADDRARRADLRTARPESARAADAVPAAPYRLTLSAPPYPDTDAFARILVDSVPERLVWGSDWPHVICKTAMPNDGDLADLLVHWVPDAATRHRILVDNAAELYDFPRG